MQRPKILVIAGSIRSASVNTKLANSYISELVNHECEITNITLADYELPIYDGDLEAEKGVPKNAQMLAKLFHAHQGILIVSPEYNGSITPLIKNTIDWISRVGSVNGEPISPFKGKVAAIAAASPGARGGSSNLYHLRDILVHIKMLVISESLSVGNASIAFEEDGTLKNERSAIMLKEAAKSLVEKASLLV